jgi:hypothetical protein
MKCSQHGLQRKRWPAVPAFGVVRCNEADQLASGNDLFHLLEEPALAGFLALQIKVQGGLFHAMYFIATGRFLNGEIAAMNDHCRGDSKTLPLWSKSGTWQFLEHRAHRPQDSG